MTEALRAKRRLARKRNRWLTIDDCKLVEGMYLTVREEREDPAAEYFDGYARWNGVKHDRPTHVLYLGTDPVLIPEPPRGSAR